MIEFNWFRDSFEIGLKMGLNCLFGLLNFIVLKS